MYLIQIYHRYILFTVYFYLLIFLDWRRLTTSHHYYVACLTWRLVFSVLHLCDPDQSFVYFLNDNTLHGQSLWLCTRCSCNSLLHSLMCQWYVLYMLTYLFIYQKIDLCCFASYFWCLLYYNGRSRYNNLETKFSRTHQIFQKLQPF